jgi:hypothetical protein
VNVTNARVEQEWDRRQSVEEYVRLVHTVDEETTQYRFLLHNTGILNAGAKQMKANPKARAKGLKMRYIPQMYCVLPHSCVTCSRDSVPKNSTQCAGGQDVTNPTSLPPSLSREARAIVCDILPCLCWSHFCPHLAPRVGQILPTALRPCIRPRSLQFQAAFLAPFK